MNFYDSIVRWGVPVFVMISGCLFLSGNTTLKKIYQKNIFRIARAFIFWSIFYATYYYVGKVFILKKEVALTTVIARIVFGNYHMWFLYMITGIYMILPFLQQIASSKFLTKYFLILAFVFAILIPQSKSIALEFIAEHHEAIESFYNRININFVVGFAIYFLLGYALNKIEISKKTEFIMYFLGVIGFTVTFLMTSYVSRSFQEPKEIFYGSHTINVFFESVFIFILFKQRISRLFLIFINEKWLILLSKYSFGAYLVHDFIIDMLNILGLTTISFNPVLSIPVISVIVFIISFFISGIFNNVPILKKFV